MPNGIISLLGGRHAQPLDQRDQLRTINTFLGMEARVAVRYEAGARTVFHVVTDDHGNQYGEIVFSEDIYPGVAVVDPNASLSMNAAAAHELSHFHRWKDKTEILAPELGHIDEALTSLGAISRYQKHLDEHEVRQLVSDAILRLQLFVQEQTEPEQGV